jgi:hypothetical protein
VVAIDQQGTVVLDSGRAGALTPAAGRSRPTAATVSPSGAAARSSPCHLASTREASLSCPIVSFRSRGASASAPATNCTCRRASDPQAKVTTRSPCSTTNANCSRRGW